MRHGSLEKNTALAAAAGVFSALAVWFLLKGDAQAPNAVQSFAEARAMVADGAAVAIEYRRTNSPYMRPIVAAMKRWLGADENNGNSQGRRFLALSGLDEADVRWALFSMDAVSLTASGELDKMPDWALAVSFPHDLAKIARVYEEVAGDNPPLRLEEAGIGGAAAFRVRSGRDGSALFVAASLDGELLFITPDERVAARQIALYRDGSGEEPLFGEFASDDENAFRLYVPHTGRLLSKVIPPKGKRPKELDAILADAGAAISGIEETDLIVVAGEGEGLALKLALRAATDEDADRLATIVKAARLHAGEPAKRLQVTNEGAAVFIVAPFTGEEVRAIADSAAAIL